MDSIPAKRPVSVSPRIWLVRWLGILALGAVLVACEDEPIATYRVAKEVPPAGVAGPGDAAPNAQRMLAAVVARADQTWFFKLAGTREEVASAKNDFDAFVRSVRFEAGPDGMEKPTWKTPANWHEHGGSGIRFATFHVQGTNHKLTISVMALGGEAGGLLANVNRWRGQIGLEAIEAGALDELIRRETVDGVEMILVDMAAKDSTSPGQPETPTRKTVINDKPAPLATGRASKPSGRVRKTQGPISFEVPVSWKSAPSGGMRVAAFSVDGEGKPALVTVIPLGGAAGGGLSNYNRWRRQVGLGPATQEEYEKAAEVMAVDSIRSSYVDVVGPEAGGDQRPRILAVSVPRESRIWFFKMTGPAKLLEQQKSNFERFVQSIRFENKGS